MKPSVAVLVMLFALTFACKEQDKKIVVVDQKPDDIFNIELCPELTTNVMKLLTESQNNQEKYPQLFSSSTQEKIVLTKDADIYVSYVTEGASVNSTLGYYTYKNDEPSGAGAIDKKIALPNVSNSILVPGDSRFIGSFKAGTTIGFFMVVGGYNNNTVNFEKPTYYTTPSWNADGMRQHILFREKTCNNLVMAFEDKNLAGQDYDADFNDIIFLVSDNDSNQPVTSFQTDTIAEM